MRAFGYCLDTLDPQNPDRLCRGRERWIEPLLDPADPYAQRVHRLVVSGANFSDDSARDATRGLVEAGVTADALLKALFPRRHVHAFREVGDPRALPAEMIVEEDWTFTPGGGLRRTPAVRWLTLIQKDEADAYMLGEKGGLAAPRADGLLIDAKVSPELEDALFKLVGFSDPEGRPALLYNAMGIPAVLEHCRALVLFHLDKHGPAFVVYTTEPLDASETLVEVAAKASSFAVPFSIPPMLARWDRALYELRLGWDEESQGPFPVPVADDAGGRWSRRRRQERGEDEASSADDEQADDEHVEGARDGETGEEGEDEPGDDEDSTDESSENGDEEGDDELDETGDEPGEDETGEDEPGDDAAG